MATLEYRCTGCGKPVYNGFLNTTTNEAFCYERYDVDNRIHTQNSPIVIKGELWTIAGLCQLEYEEKKKKRSIEV